MEQKLKTDLSKFNPKEFDRGASSLKFFIWHWVNVFFFMSSFFPSSTIRIFLLRLFGAKVGKGVVISKPGVNIKMPWRLVIGNHVWIGEQAWIYNLDLVEIGDNVNIAQGAMILTGNHDYRKVHFPTIFGPVKIFEDDTTYTYQIREKKPPIESYVSRQYRKGCFFVVRKSDCKVVHNKFIYH